VRAAAAALARGAVDGMAGVAGVSGWRGGGAHGTLCGVPPIVPQERERRVDGPANLGEEICHIVTDEDPDTALCGKDVTGWPWNPPWPYCVVCLDLMGEHL